MLRSIMARNIPCGIRVATYPINITSFKFVRYNSTTPDGGKITPDQIKSSLDELKNPDPLAGLGGNEDKINNPNFEIEALLNKSLDDSDIFSTGYRSQFESQLIETTPRDIAKTINEFTMASGRSVDVRYGNVGKGLQQLSRVLGESKIATLAKRQERYIRPALLRKLKKREWWRRKFDNDFHDLMQKINNAKRRGY